MTNIKKHFFPQLANMADDKKPAKQRTDNWFGKVQKWFNETLGKFVAALFLIFAMGALFGASIVGTQHSWLLFIPFALALLSYYNRDFALVGLGFFVLLFFV